MISSMPMRLRNILISLMVWASFFGITYLLTWWTRSIWPFLIFGVLIAGAAVFGKIVSKMRRAEHQ